MVKWVYSFGDGKAEGASAMKNLLGGKGANLAEMATLGLPVPPGFTITTEVCTYYYANGQTLSAGRSRPRSSGAGPGRQARPAGTFGDAQNPLLVSVRSGARASMPGMMDTVLNLGLSDVTVEGLAKPSGDERFAFDSYRRFIQMYSERGARASTTTMFEEILDVHKDRPGRHARHRALGRGLARDGRRATRRRWSARPASRSRRTRASSSGARSAPCSPPG